MRAPSIPRTLADETNIAARRSLLGLPHISPLTDFAKLIRETDGTEVPEFDPLDGGLKAEILFLLEKPGPMAASSGFISRDNDDPTAEATFQFLRDIGLDRDQTVLWNAVPGWNGTRKVTAKERKAGTIWVSRLVGLLPNLKVIVLVGRNAQKLHGLLAGLGLPIVHSFHPSPLVKARYPKNWAGIPKSWFMAADLVKKR